MAYKSKEDQKAASRRHYQKNRSSIIARSKERNKAQRIRNRAFIARVKSFLSCVDCGESDPRVLDFDHVRGVKKNNVSDMASGAYSISRIKKEIRKCEVRCANCHRKATNQRRENS